MPKRVIPLTDTKIRATLRDIKANNINGLDTDVRLSDGDGLNLLIRKTGAVMWRFDYTRPITKKRNTMSIGTYPEVSLARAREMRTQYRALLAQNLDPQEEKNAVTDAERARRENTFQAVAELFKSKEDVKAGTKIRNERIYQKLFREIGQMPISDIQAKHLVKAIEKEENKGFIENAKRMRAKASQVFRFAVKRGLCERDVAHDLIGTIKKKERTHYPALTDPFDFARLLVDIDGYKAQSISVKYALKLAPLVFVRIGELRQAKWADINLDAKTWSYTPSKTASKTGVEHIVPLSKQAIAILEHVHQFTNNSIYVFPSRSDKNKPMSDMAINMAMRHMEYSKDEMVGHGFRAIARTLLDEVLGFPIEIIEQQLAHQVRDMHGRAYNRTKHLDKRTAMMQRWSDYCDELKEKYISSKESFKQKSPG